MRLRGIVLEGLTGAGKTSVLNALRRTPGFFGAYGEATVHDEDATMGGTLVPGDVMDELGDSGKPDSFRWRRLEAVLSAVEFSRSGNERPGPFIIERFHLTYYDLMPDGDLFSAYDARAAALNGGIVLLSYPESDIASQALHRPDRSNSQWLQEMTHGTDESIVVERLRVAMMGYRQALSRSKLPSIIIDTASMDWNSHARQIHRFVRGV